VNRGLEKGEVKLRKSEIVRIIQEAIYERIKKDLPLDVPVVICEAISGYTGDIKKGVGGKAEKFGDDAGFGFDFESDSG